MSENAATTDLEGLARIIDPPAWLEHDDLIARAEGWERANKDRPDEAFARMAEGRRRDAAELVRMSRAKAEKAWEWIGLVLEQRRLAMLTGYGATFAEAMADLELKTKAADHG